MRRQARTLYEPCDDLARGGEETYHHERGWLEGYCDVANGGNGAPPALPPEEYWGAQYRNGTGQSLVQNWYRGYADGAQVAFRSSAHDYNFIPSPHRGDTGRHAPGPDVNGFPVEQIPPPRPTFSHRPSVRAPRTASANAINMPRSRRVLFGPPGVAPQATYDTKPTESGMPARTYLR